MSKNIVEIKQNDSSSKNNLPKAEIIPGRNNTNHKKLYCTKRILLICNLIFLIATLFIFCSYLLLSQNSKIPKNSDELSKEKKRGLDIQNITPITKLKPILEYIDPPSVSPTPLPNNKFVSSTEYERKVLLISNYLSKKENGQYNVSPDILYNILN